MKHTITIGLALASVVLAAMSCNAQEVAAAHTQTTATQGPAIQRDKPIDISSDKLDVYQDEHKAVFTGNVIAAQGTTNMRSVKMTVFYRGEDGANKDGKKPPVPAPAAAVKNDKTQEEKAQGIEKIVAEENVFFTTPTETARGDIATYYADSDTIVLTGGSVILTRDQNILKGTKLVYNMATDRSVLTSENGATVPGSTADGVAKPARVHGLFVPKSSDKNKTDTDKNKTDGATTKAN